MANKAWIKASDLGIWDEDDDCAYVVDIKHFEQKDWERISFKDVPNLGAKWMYCLTTSRG